MDTKNKKHYLFIGVSTVVIVFLIVMIILINMVHTPYSKHQQQGQSLRNELLSSNKMQYDHYFYPYYGEKTYYIMKVKQDGKKKLVAFDEKKKLVGSYEGNYMSDARIKEKVKKEHHEVKAVHICYEDDKFMYYAKYQNKNHLYYYFYSLEGDFVKSYNL
ncbi:hypothetical protein [Kandleria vitulina]|uniref:hypothetical protein n=1 Tax=Kandleria vitulina TaxID=1630 RepID=UPI0004909ACA|nr:hypothetical protein [Kandleria vitulina]